MFHVCGLYVSCLRPLCFMLAASIYDTCYDRGRIAFWGARKRLGALAVLCGFERRACKQRGWEAGLKHRGWVRAFVFVLLYSCFWGSCFSVVLFVVRAFGRSFRGSCFWVRSFGRSFCGSFFWFVLLGARMCFFFDALKFLEACVARSEVS